MEGYMSISHGHQSKYSAHKGSLGLYKIYAKQIGCLSSSLPISDLAYQLWVTYSWTLVDNQPFP